MYIYTARRKLSQEDRIISVHFMMLVKFLERWLPQGKIALSVQEECGQCVRDSCYQLAQQQFQIILSKYCVMNGKYKNRSDYVLYSRDLWLAFLGIFGQVTIFEPFLPCELLCQHTEYLALLILLYSSLTLKDSRVSNHSSLGFPGKL